LRKPAIVAQHKLEEMSDKGKHNVLMADVLFLRETSGGMDRDDQEEGEGP